MKEGHLNRGVGGGGVLIKFPSAGNKGSYYTFYTRLYWYKCLEVEPLKFINRVAIEQYSKLRAFWSPCE